MSVAKKKTPFPLWLTITPIILWLAFYTFSEEISDIFTPFLAGPFLLLFLAITSSLSTICLIRTLYCWISDGFSYGVWIRLIAIAIFVVSFFIPLDALYEKARLSILAPAFDAAAQEMSVTSVESGLVSLPAKYAYLSRGGKVIIVGEGENKAVLFFQARLIHAGFKGYAYAPNSQAYKYLQEYENWTQVDPMREDWYYCN